MSDVQRRTKIDLQLNSIAANICYAKNPIYVVTDWSQRHNTIITAYQIGEDDFVNIVPNMTMKKLIMVIGKMGNCSSNSIDNLFGNDVYDDTDNIKIIHREYTRFELDDSDIDLLTDIYNTIAFVINHAMSVIITRNRLKNSIGMLETETMFNTPYGTTCILLNKKEE